MAKKTVRILLDQYWLIKVKDEYITWFNLIDNSFGMGKRQQAFVCTTYSIAEGLRDFCKLLPGGEKAKIRYVAVFETRKKKK